MESERKTQFHTRVIHATLPPIFQGAAHCHEAAEHIVGDLAQALEKI